MFSSFGGCACFVCKCGRMVWGRKGELWPLLSLHSFSLHTTSKRRILIDTLLTPPTSPSPAALKLARLVAQHHHHRPGPNPGPDELAEALVGCGIPISDPVSVEVLRLQPDARCALRFFILAGRHVGFHALPRSRKAVLAMWSRAPLIAPFLRLLPSLHEKGFAHTRATRLTLIKGLGWAGMVGEAVQVIEAAMRNIDSPPGLKELNCLIDVLVKSDCLDGAIQVFYQIHRMGMVPNAVTCTCLVRGLCGAGKVLEAVQLIQEMTMKGCRWDTKAYNTFIEVLSKEGRADMAHHLFMHMESRGCKTNRLTDALLIGALFRAGGEASMSAYRHLESLIRNDSRPDIRSYGKALSQLCKAEKAEEASALLHLLKSKGCEIDSYTYSSIFVGLLKARKIDSAVETMDQMCVQGLPANTVLRSSVVNFLCRSNNSNACLRFIDKIRRNSPPNIAIYSAIIHRLCKQGDMLSAEDVMKQMMENGCTPDMVLFTTLIQGYFELNNFDRACRLFCDIIRKGFTPDIVLCNVLLTGLLKEGGLDKALSFFEDIQSLEDRSSSVDNIHQSMHSNSSMYHRLLLEIRKTSSFIPNVFTYNILMSHVCSENLNDGYALFEEVKRDCKPDVVTYCILINHLCKAERFQEAFDMWNEMIRQGFKPPISICNIVVQNLCKRGRITDAYNFFLSLHERGCCLDIVAAKILSDCLHKVGRLHEASEVYRVLGFANM